MIGRRLLHKLAVIQDDEAASTFTAARAFFCILAAYYLLIPVRDEAAVALGTATLPTLFLVSLPVTLVAAPAAGAFLNRGGVSRGVAVHQMYRLLATSIVGFAILHWCCIGRPHGSASQISTAPLAAQWWRRAFYLWVSAANLVAVSTMWARAADAFAPSAAARLFGLLGAGATAGQLAGSTVAGLAATACQRLPALSAALPLLLMLGAALLLEAAGRAAGALKPTSETQRPGAQEAAATQPHPQGGLAGLTAGFRLIAASGYLRQVAVFMGCNYVVSSAFYFEKAAVVASGMSSSASRTAFFAAVNGASAAIIGCVQVVLTGRLLRQLSPSAALAALPLAAGVLMAFVSLSPTPASVAGAEVLRKVVAYGIARPAREVLFTVVSRDSKYRAKVVLDTMVQRTGDAVAAAAFSFLQGPVGLGPSGFAAAVVPVCVLWAALGVSLGRQQQAMQVAAQHKAEGMIP